MLLCLEAFPAEQQRTYCGITSSNVVANLLTSESPFRVDYDSAGGTERLVYCRHNLLSTRYSKAAQNTLQPVCDRAVEQVHELAHDGSATSFSDPSRCVSCHLSRGHFLRSLRQVGEGTDFLHHARSELLADLSTPTKLRSCMTAD